MKCRRAKDLIYDFIDGVICDPERSELENHLGACQRCEAMAESLSKSLNLLHRAPVEPLDDNFTWKVRLRLGRARNAAETDAEVQRGWLKAWNARFVLSAAATFVAVVGVGYFVASSLVLPNGAPTSTPLLAQQPQPLSFQPTENLRANESVADQNRPTFVSNLGANPAGGGLLAEAPYTNLDSLKAEVYKSRLEDEQVKLLLDQVNHLQSELRSCESQCPKEGNN